MKAALMFLVLLAGCAAPQQICLLDTCADLQDTLKDLEAPDIQKSICAAGAMTPACNRGGRRI